MAVVHQRQRDEMPESDFAVPGKRDLLIHDATHVKLAWDMVDRTHGLSDEERAEARRRIIRRAHELGVDTSGWSKDVKGALDLQAMSLDVPETPGHPNKRPFKGILTRIDEPSDDAPHGSGGRLVLLTKAAAEAALPTLLGMAVDSMPGFGGHAESRKIGIITAAEIKGSAVEIEGYFFAKDFPQEMRQISAQKEKLGFSFELTPTKFEVTSENLFRVDACVFTGAALLYKDKAAYHSTSLAAAKTHTKEFEMELKDLVEAVGKLTAAVEAQGSAIADLQKKTPTGNGISASAECMAAVEPHAKALEEAAGKMQAAGIGMHPTHGHVRVLHRMAAHLRASAALGHLPHIYRDHDYPMSASADGPADAAVTKAIDELKASQAKLTEGLASITTGLADLKAERRQNTEQPARKTLPPQFTALLARHGISATGDDGKPVSEEALSHALKKAGVEPEKRIEIMRGYERAAQGMPV